MKQKPLRDIIKEAVRQEIRQGENPGYGKHNYDREHLSVDYTRLISLEKSINALPRKISERSVSANFQNIHEPFEPSNPRVTIVFQEGVNTKKIYLTLKEFNKNNPLFVFIGSPEDTKKSKKVSIPDFSSNELTKEQITKEIGEWLQNYITPEKLKEIIKEEFVKELSVSSFDKKKYDITGDGIISKTKKDIVFRNKDTNEIAYTIPANDTVYVWFSPKKHPTFGFVQHVDEIKIIRLATAFDKLTKFQRPPSMSTLMRWSNDGIGLTVLGNRVEPDGYDHTGAPSWELVLGII